MSDRKLGCAKFALAIALCVVLGFSYHMITLMLGLDPNNSWHLVSYFVIGMGVSKYVRNLKPQDYEKKEKKDK